MKRLFKWLLILSVFVLIALAIVPYLFKDQILNKIKEAANERIHAHLDFDNAKSSLGLLWTFPNLTCTIGNLSVKGKEEFEDKVLANSQTVYCSINIFNALFGKYIIDEMNFNKVDINATVLPNGKANFDILKPRQKKRDIIIKTWLVEEANLQYTNEQRYTKIDLKNVKHWGERNLLTTTIDLTSQTTAEEIGFSLANMGNLKKSNLSMGLKLSIDTTKKVLKIIDNELKTKNLTWRMNGDIAQGKDTQVDLKYNITTSALATFLPLVSTIAAKYFEESPRKSIFKLDGYVKGGYNPQKALIPDYGMSLVLQNERFKDFKIPLTLGQLNRELMLKFWELF